MKPIKTRPTSGDVRGEPLRQHVLDAAERLLGDGKADFSMRDLAAEAGVSFATPFNQFGSKGAIMHALSARRIDTMSKRFAEAARHANAEDRVLLAISLAADVMLEKPAINRTVMSWIGTVGSGAVLAHSSAFWSLVLGAGEGLNDDALTRLPGQLAFAFRGILSFWTAGELSDDALRTCAHDMARSLLIGFGGRRRRIGRIGAGSQECE